MEDSSSLQVEMNGIRNEITQPAKRGINVKSAGRTIPVRNINQSSMKIRSPTSDTIAGKL